MDGCVCGLFDRHDLFRVILLLLFIGEIKYVLLPIENGSWDGLGVLFVSFSTSPFLFLFSLLFLYFRNRAHSLGLCIES